MLTCPDLEEVRDGLGSLAYFDWFIATTAHIHIAAAALEAQTLLRYADTM